MESRSSTSKHDWLVYRRLDKLAECEGIEIVGTPVVAFEDEVTIAELKRCARLDDWDDLSRG